MTEALHNRVATRRERFIAAALGSFARELETDSPLEDRKRVCNAAIRLGLEMEAMYVARGLDTKP